MLDSRPRGRGFEPNRRHCVMVLEQGLVLIQPRKTRPCLTERLLMGRKESKQTKKHNLYTAHPTMLVCYMYLKRDPCEWIRVPFGEQRKCMFNIKVIARVSNVGSLRKSYGWNNLFPAEHTMRVNYLPDYSGRYCW